MIYINIAKEQELYVHIKDMTLSYEKDYTEDMRTKLAKILSEFFVLNVTVEDIYITDDSNEL